MGYDVGIDLGVATVAAAAMRDRRVTLVPLTESGPLLTPNLLVEGDTVAVGIRESEVLDPDHFVTELVADLGHVDVLDVAGRDWSVVDLTAIVLRHVLDLVRAAQGPELDHVVLAHPAAWPGERVARLVEAAEQAGAPGVRTISALEAVAIRLAAGVDLDPGDRVLVADYGGGSFQGAVLERVGDRFVVVGAPVVVERVGGIDVDDAVLAHVLRALGEAFSRLDPQDPGHRRAVAALCERCVEAKEGLRDVETIDIDVVLRGNHSVVRLDGTRLDELAAPVVRRTLGPLRDLVAATGTDVARLRAVQLVGGGSLLAIVPDLVEGALGVAVTVDPYPQWSAALGAAISSALGPLPAEPGPGGRGGDGPDLVSDGVDARILGLEHDPLAPPPGTRAPAAPAEAEPTSRSTTSLAKPPGRPAAATERSAPPPPAPPGADGDLDDPGPASRAEARRPAHTAADVDRLYPDRRLVRILMLFLGFLLVVACAVGALILLERDEGSGGPAPTTTTTAPPAVGPTVAGASATTPATSPVDAARSRLDALTRPVADVGVTSPLPGPVAPTRLALLRLDQGDGPLVEPDVVAAAAVLGHEVQVVGLGSTRESAVAGWQEAVGSTPGAVLAGGVPSELVGDQLAVLAAAGVPVVEWASTDEVGGAVVDVLVGLDDYRLNGELLADVVAVSANPGPVVMFRHDDAVARAVEEGLAAGLAAACDSCPLDVVTVRPEAVGVDLPGLVVAYLRDHPEVRWVALGIGQMALGVPDALDGAGLSASVGLLTQAGGTLNAGYVAAGRQAADVAFPTGVLAYRLVDSAARALAGGPPAVTDPVFPRRVLIPGTVADVDPAVGWRGPPGFEDAFRALWGV